MKNWRELRSASNRCRYLTGDSSEAVRFLCEAIQAAEQSEPLVVPHLLNSLSNLLASIGDFVGSEDAARKSITAELQYGPPIRESDRLGSYHSALSFALQKQGKFSEALMNMDEAILIFSLHFSETEELMQNLRRLRLELNENSWRG